MKKIEIALDITEQIATWSVHEVRKLFEFLDQNSFVKIYFDGSDASIFVLKHVSVEDD
jgi:hypothetical protein